MTRKENYLGLLEGKMPEFVPIYIKDCDVSAMPELLSNGYSETKPDIYGVAWTKDSTGDMPTPNRKLLDSMENWRDMVHFPDLDKYDWEGLAKFVEGHHDPDKVHVFMASTPTSSLFLPIVNMMGFVDGLCALVEEPEACEDFLEASTNFHIEVIHKAAKYLHPDIVVLFDDICSAQNLFFSYDCFKEMFKPRYKRMVDAIIEEGCIPEFHCCGNCSLIVDDFVDMGVRIWQPVQSQLNDVLAMKEKYGSQLIYNGIWQVDGPGALPNTPEEEVRQAVRNCIDTYFKDGGMIFHAGSTFGTTEEAQRRFQWVYDEAEKYGREVYRR